MQDINESICQLFESIGEKLKRNIEVQARLHHLSMLQLRILLLLHKSISDQMNNLSTLSTELQLSKPTVSVALRPLYLKKMVSFKKNGSDQRIKCLELTERGRQIAQISAYYNKDFLTLIKTVKTEEKAVLLKILAGMNHKMS